MKNTKLIIFLIVIFTFVITGCNDKKNNIEEQATVQTTTTKITSTEPTTNSMTTTSHQEEQKTVTTTSKTLGTTKSTTRKTISKTTKSKKTTTRATTRKNTTTKKTTTVTKKSCTPERSLPEGAVWYKVWGPDNPIDYFDYQDWADTVDDMKMLKDALWDIPNVYNILGTSHARTEGGLIIVSCKGDAFSIYGTYIEINGYLSLYDENRKYIGEEYVLKGYVRPDGSKKYIYKKY